MDRSIPLLLIGLVFGGGIGFLVAAGNGVTLDGHDHADSVATAKTGPLTGEHSHSGVHDQKFEWPKSARRPALELRVEPDRVSGWNVHLEVSDFAFAPENASGRNVLGEGHAHLYVNDVKIARIYSNWVHVPSLPFGDIVIRAELNTNDHRPIFVDNVALAKEISIQAGQDQSN